jgi:DNA processing protein
MAVAAGVTDSQRLSWLRLIRTDNVGPQTFRQLLNREGSAEAAIEALPRYLRHYGRPVRVPSVAEAEDEVAALEKLGGRIVLSADPDYPALLHHIHGAPPVLSLLGGRSINYRRTIAIVGARNASAAGQKMTRILAGELGEAGYTIVSGLARGIDAAAHKASLSTGTIAALAGGMDRIYPAENIPLAEEIVASGGVLVSEMPMGWEPRARDFPRRNRLVSGLSLGVVVVEAAKRSGSLITARLALEQNREVFAVPGSPLDPRAEGGNALIQEGAKLVTGAADIIESLSAADPTRGPLLESDLSFRPAPVEEPPSDSDRARLLEAMSMTPTPADELVKATGLGVGAVQTLLLELDLEGRIEWSSGQLVALRP